MEFLSTGHSRRLVQELGVRLVGGKGMVGYVVNWGDLGKGDQSIPGFCKGGRRLIHLRDEGRCKPGWWWVFGSFMICVGI